MTSLKDFKVKRQIIMDHYLKPLNKGVIHNEQPLIFFSKYCVDKLSLYVQIVDQKIINISFEGEGCAIFLASTDLMIETIKNKTIAEVKNILINYIHLINQVPPYDEEVLKKLVIFNNVKAQLNRLYCAEIIYLALNETIYKSENK